MSSFKFHIRIVEDTTWPFGISIVDAADEVLLWVNREATHEDQTSLAEVHAAAHFGNSQKTALAENARQMKVLTDLVAAANAGGSKEPPK